MVIGKSLLYHRSVIHFSSSEEVEATLLGIKKQGKEGGKACEKLKVADEDHVCNFSLSIMEE